MHSRAQRRNPEPGYTLHCHYREFFPRKKTIGSVVGGVEAAVVDEVDAGYRVITLGSGAIDGGLRSGTRQGNQKALQAKWI